VTKLSLLLPVVAALGFAPGAPARPQTTEPSEVNDVKVLLTDRGLRLSRLKFERGNQARFLVRNTGTRPYRFKAGFLSTKLLSHGGHEIMFVHLGTRGRYAVEEWSASGRVARAFIRVV
jgi:hypothetical protein